MSKSFSRRRFLHTALAASVVPNLPDAARGAAPAPKRLVAGTRVLEVNGRPAKVFGLTGPDGRPGIRLAAGERFRALLKRPNILQIPGAHSGMASLLAKAAGFDAVYVGGSAMTGTMGLPDLGIITVDEVCFYIRQVARASGLPLLVDGDTGHGEALNVMQMVRSFEDAGAAAVHIEDQLLPKKCGHLNDKKLADARDAAAKIAAAVKARRDLYIIARTDAADAEGMDGAVARAKLYLEAGADAIFPEALINAEMFREFARRVKAPLLANMTEFGRTPVFTASEFQDMGYQMVIWPASAMRVAAKAQEELYAAIKRGIHLAPTTRGLLP